MKQIRRLLSVLLSMLLLLNAVFAGGLTALAAEVDTTDYEAFLSNLEVLEGYAADYVQKNTSDNTTQLVINYVRTGVDKYTTSSWEILAGAENKDFTQYVATQDALYGTTASDLKSLHNFQVPNGDDVDFAHMFGSMDVAYYSTAQGASASLVRSRADLASWAGDVCDLVLISSRDKTMAADDVETLSQLIYDKYLGENYDYAFGQDDIYGDLDSFYILEELKKGDHTISEIIRDYFTESLTDEARADYFLKNRFESVVSKNDIRALVYRAYINNSLMYTLECSRSLQYKTDLRTACLYAFADYLFNLAGDPDAEDTVGEEEETLADNDYYSVFSSTTTKLAPGVKQDVKYALTKDNKQIAYYLATVDINRDDVNLYANYNNNDPTSWAMSRVTDQMAVIQAKHSDPEDTENYIENYNTIVGVNADFFNMTTGKPTGVLVMDGVEYAPHNYRADRGFFALLKDGTPVIGSGTDWDEIRDNVREAVGGSLVLIKDGELVNQGTVSDYYGTRAPRTAIGVTAEGKLVLMVLDGRQEPFSAGGNLAEIAQIMLDAGCVEAINLDGGGSSTFAAKQEGADEVTIVNRPSDGYERSVSSSLVVVSTAEPSNKFDHLLIETETDYLTVGSSLEMTLNGVSTTGNSAEIPEGATYQLVNDTVGHIDQDVFYADREGETEVRVVYDGEVIGSKTLYVVTPERVFFTKTSMDLIFGVSTPLPISATYGGNPVKINVNDIDFSLSNSAAGVFDGFTFTASEDCGLKNTVIYAMLSSNYDIKAQLSVSMYDEGAAIFDFDNAMFGDRLLAWNRVVDNATTTNNKAYYIIQKGDMPAEYTFAIDARAIPFPPQLASLVGMVAGSDVEGVTPWNILLQLAERVSAMTEVTVTLRFAEGIDIDYSNIAVVNDYFYLKSATMAENANNLIIKIGWRKQSEPIDAETANPICILSGIRVTPTDAAGWNEEDNTLNVAMSGSLHYDIGLRASSLYTMSQDPTFQQTYGITDYVNPDDPSDKGGFMMYDFLSIEDIFTLDRSMKQGWQNFNGTLYYFEDNQPLTGVHQLPSLDDPTTLIYYNLGEDGAKHELYTGLIEEDGNVRYALRGVLRTGWFAYNTDNYYFDENGNALDGEQVIDGYHFLFENHILKEGQLIHTNLGTIYRWADGYLSRAWFEYQGNTYYVNESRYLETGLTMISLSNSGYSVHLFDENGALLHTYTDEGLVSDGDLTVYVKDGFAQYQGLVQDDEGNIYYINSAKRAVKDCDYPISAAKTNGILPADTYHFGPDGKLVIDFSKNGLCFDDDGEIRYYVDGLAQYQGLVKADDGSIYYITSQKKAAKNCTCTVYSTKTNGILTPGTYEFGPDGKLVVEEAKNGLCFDDDGEIRYYVNGVAQYQGFVQDEDGNVYYINSAKTAVKDCVYAVNASKVNGILPSGTYQFDADGKVVGAVNKKTITVSGKVVFAKDVEGTATNYGLRGVVVYAVDKNGEIIAQTTTYSSEEYTAEEKAKFGTFTLEVPTGTTQLWVGDPEKGGDCIVNRSFTVAGTRDVTGAVIPVVSGDFNDDGVINPTDKGRFNDSLRGEYSIYADFNLDGVVNSTDKGSFNDLLRTGTVEYTDLSF